MNAFITRQHLSNIPYSKVNFRLLLKLTIMVNMAYVQIFSAVQVAKKNQYSIFDIMAKKKLYCCMAAIRTDFFT